MYSARPLDYVSPNPWIDVNFSSEVEPVVNFLDFTSNVMFTPSVSFNWLDSGGGFLGQPTLVGPGDYKLELQIHVPPDAQSQEVGNFYIEIWPIGMADPLCTSGQILILAE